MYILSHPLKWKWKAGEGTQQRTSTGASERAIEKEREVERGEEGERDRGASVDAGKDEKLPLSSGGGGNGVAVSVLGGGGVVRGIAFFLPFPSLFPRRKWPLDVTVIILRASLARKNERTQERERESDARTVAAAAAAATKMPVGGREAKGRASERASG